MAPLITASVGQATIHKCPLDCHGIRCRDTLPSRNSPRSQRRRVSVLCCSLGIVGAGRCSRPRVAAVADEVASTEAGCLFEVTPISGKGLAAVASQEIGCGTLVLAEAPLLYFQNDDQWLASAQEQFNSLPADAQTAIMSLHAENTKEGEKTLENVINTNGMGCDVKFQAAVLCCTTSRFNHSCTANCELFWDDVASCMKVFACKDIERGEELCLSYIEPFLPREQRVKACSEQYGFCCNCQACTAADTASDQRRIRLGELSGIFSQGRATNADEAVALAREMLDLCDLEHLAINAFRSQACNHAFVSLLLARRAPEAKPWAEQACQYLQKARGRDHPDTIPLCQYARNPESHPAAPTQFSDVTTLAASAVAGIALSGIVWFCIQLAQ